MKVRIKQSPGRILALGFATVIVTGALLLCLPILLHPGVTISPADALFTATSATCVTGLATVDIADAFSNFGQAVVALLIQVGGLGIACIGAWPGSTGGGVKTTTAFVLFQTLRGLAGGRPINAYHRSIPRKIVMSAYLILLVSLLTVCMGTVLLCFFEPQFSFLDCLVEVVSAFATVGLSAGITPELGLPGKLLLVVIMYIGRIGPLTVISLSASRIEPGVRYSEESIMVG